MKYKLLWVTVILSFFSYFNTFAIEGVGVSGSKPLTTIITSLNITNPNGGEIYKVGSVHNITWEANGVANLKIDYTTNGGSTWSPIVASTPANTGSYAWVVPNTVSSLCKVKITGVENNALVDVSDYNFSIHATLELDMMVVKGGTFAMGSAAGSNDESPVHNVTLSAFQLGKYEVTQKLWQQIMGNNPSTHVGDNLPVAGVSWNVAQNFITSLNSLTGRYFRLPTEAEWEFAARGGVSSGGFTYSGSNTPGDIGWYNGNSNQAPHEVGTKLPNEIGLYDMSGNVTEWCNDWYDANYYGASPSSNPQGPLSGTFKVIRGGYWESDGDGVRVANRSQYLPNSASNYYGLRLAEDLFTLIVTAPNGDENWQVGTTQNITWKSSNVDNVKIQYSTNAGSTWLDVVASVSAVSGSYSWVVPNTPSGYCKVKVSGVETISLNDISDNVFTIKSAVVSTVNLTSPNGGESWLAGTNQNITWTSSNINNLKIEYSTNNGTNWSTVIASVAAANGIYQWVVPNTPSINCRIRLSDALNSATNDVSDNTFSIVVPSITVNAPNGSENWQAGTQQNITWVSNNVTNVKIEYSTNNGTNWTTVNSSIAATLGTYTWTVPSVNSTNCKVRISDVSNSAVNDISNNVFSIYTQVLGTITVNTPNGGESWQVGTTQNITWVSSNITNVKIEYSSNGGTNWTTISASVSANLGSYSWLIPSYVSTNCLVRISDVTNSNINDISNSVFTIFTPSSGTITVESPNGGESWKAGDAKEIKWESTNVTNVKIEYTTNNGTNWTKIIASTSASTGKYEWTVPNTPSTNCRVHVCDVSNNNIYDISNAVFTIEAQAVTKSLVLTNPVGGEQYKGNTTQQISWTSSNVSNIKIEFSTNNGTNWTELQPSISASQNNTNWVTWNLNSANCKIKITDVSDNSVTSQNSNNFTLFNYPDQISVAKTVTFGDVNTPSSCRIIGLPGNINNSVSQFVSGTHKTDWNAFRDNGASANYYQQYDGTEVFNFKPGRAFWVISRNGLNVNTNFNNVTIDSDNNYTIQLQAGWNLISNPFDKAVSWSKVVQKNNITLNPLLYGYPNTYTGNQTVMTPYEGYYFYNAHNLSGLKIPYNPSGVTSQQLLKGNNLFADNNAVNIQLISDNEKTSEIYVSVDDLASVDFDANDYFAAPSGFEESSIKLINNNLNTSYKYLLKDTRPIENEGLTYEFIIKAMSNKNNELVWGEIPAKYDNYEVYLIDNRINKLYDMKKIESLSIPKHYNENKYSLLIGNSDYINSVKESLTPNEFTLEQNYPNPFNPSTVIRFSTPYTSNVNISLYNVLGELVNVVIDEVKDAGTHEVTCNMQGLSAGVYFYRLDAKSIDGNKNFSNVKKMVLLK
jgi:formylglycine-generating enzyme required for sulfatase activity